MSALRYVVGFCLFLPIVAACSGNGNTTYSAPIADGRTPSVASRPTQAKAPVQNLYVASWGEGLRTSSINVYAPGSTRAIRTISQGISAPTALAFDKSGNLYVANGGEDGPCTCGPSTITIYAPGSTSPARTIALSKDEHLPYALAFDRLDNLYVMMDDVEVYAPGGSQPIRRIKMGLNVPAALAFDRSNNLFVANLYGNNVTVYASGSTSVLRTINVQGPNALAFDRSGNLYVANQPALGGGNYGPASINVYAPGAASVLRTISTGDVVSLALRFDSSGNLYTIGTNQADQAAVTVFAAGTSSVVRSIPETVMAPVAIELDASGNVYVANCPHVCGGGQGADAVRVYGPDATLPRRKIDVSGPSAIALGP